MTRRRLGSTTSLKADADELRGAGDHDDVVVLHGMWTARISVTVDRSATKNGSGASAWSGPGASTSHQMSWPPDRHDATVVAWRSGLGWPLKAANATPQWPGAWWWWSR